MLGIEDSNRFSEACFNNFNGCLKVGVAANQNGAVIRIVKGIHEKVRSDIHVRAFFLRLDNIDEFLVSERSDEGHDGMVREIMAINNGKVGYCP